jgi:hypothetical protein
MQRYKMKKRGDYFILYAVINGYSFGSNRLKRAVWREYVSAIKNGMEEPCSDQDVLSALDSIASTKVNNPNSSFYIGG